MELLITLFYEPYKPSSFVCEAAAAFIVTIGGEVEVFSPKCSMVIATETNTPREFAGFGRTSSLLDEELILLGNDGLGTKGHYVSIQKPRNDLLAINYTIENFPLRLYPHEHISLVSKNSLAVVGGKFKSKALLSKFAWRELSLHWQNGSKFIPDFIGSCSVKVAVDVHVIFGGERKDHDQSISGRQVIRVNTSEEIVYVLKPMIHGRVAHDCELLNDSSNQISILVSGGLPLEDKDKPTNTYVQDQQDEIYTIYNITSQESEDLKKDVSLRRHNHALIRMENQVYALGGRNKQDQPTSQIEMFNSTSQRWIQLPKGLQSRNATELVVTAFPTSSLDCVPECQCGQQGGRGSKRIFKGNETEVKWAISNDLVSFVLLRKTPIHGLRRFCGTKILRPATSKAHAALYWWV